jgi:hypothetical protein
MSKDARASLSPDELRVLDAMLDIEEEWSQRPRGAERAGALAAIGGIWTRLGWLTIGVNASQERLRTRQRKER